MKHDGLLYRAYGDPGLFDTAVPLTRKWRLHGLRCRVCYQTWLKDGYQYPLVDLSSLTNEADYHSPHAVYIEEFERRRDQLRPLVPAHLPLVPGNYFGPLSGRASGEFGSFGWLFASTMLIRREVATKLVEYGLNMPSFAETSISYTRTKDVPDFIEYQLDPSGLMKNSPKPKCKVCQCVRVKKPSDLIVRGDSIHTEHDIFRLEDLSTCIMVSEQFYRVARDLELTHIMFEPVTVV